MTRGALIAETEYALADRENEKKWSFKLADALAKAHESKLLDGCTFYITKNVEPNFKVLTDIVKAAGGKVRDFAHELSNAGLLTADRFEWDS